MQFPICYINTRSEIDALARHEHLIDFGGYTLERFMQCVAWSERTSARREAFFSVAGDPYTYGKGAGIRTYYPSAYPEWMLPLKRYTEAITGSSYDLCFLNRYDDQHQHLGWHADDADSQDQNAPIVVQSFGAAREIFFRANPGSDCLACNGRGYADCFGAPVCDVCDGSGKHPTGLIGKQLLADGSTLVMNPGMQQTHQHKIPKHSAPCGPRVSLTWRKLRA